MRGEGRWGLNSFKKKISIVLSIVSVSLFSFPLTERFFYDNSRVLGRSVNNSRGDVVAICQRLNRAANSDLPALLLDIIKVCLDALVLHRVLDRAVADTGLRSVAYGVGLDVLDHGVAELFKDGFVDVDALHV